MSLNTSPNNQDIANNQQVIDLVKEIQQITQNISTLMERSSKMNREIMYLKQIVDKKNKNYGNYDFENECVPLCQLDSPEQ
jgi:DNA-binding transcriptional regulator WhiA